MSSDCPEVFAFGKMWKTRSIMVSYYLGTISNKMKRSSRQNVRQIDKHINQTKNYRQFCHVGNQIEDGKLGVFRDASFASDFPDLKINDKRFTVRIWITHVCSLIVDVLQANRSFLQRCRVLNCFAGRRFTQGWFASSSIFGVCVLETLSTKPGKGIFERHKREKAIQSHSHSDNCVCESIDHIPP